MLPGTRTFGAAPDHDHASFDEDLALERYLLRRAVIDQLAVLVRVASLLFVPLWAIAGINVAGSLWALAFGLYFVRYLPLLARARPDGRPG